MIRCKIRKHTKAVAVLILCVAVCIILMAAFGGERKIPFFGTWRIEREVIIPELTPELTSGMPLEEAMFVTTDFIGYELEYTGDITVRENQLPAILITLYCRNGQLKTHITP